MAVRTRWWVGTGLALVLGMGCGGPLDEDDDGLVGVQIGPDGGLVASEDGVLSIIVPPGAVTDTVVVTIELTGESPPSVGTAYRVQPSIDLAEPAVIAYRYTGVDLADRSPAALALAYDDGGTWASLTSLGVDEVTQQIAAQDTRLSFAYGVIEGGAGTDTDSPDTETTGDPQDTDANTDGPTTSDGSTSATDDTPVGGCGDGRAEANELCLEVGEAIPLGAGLLAAAVADFDPDDALDVAVVDAAGDLFVLQGDGAGGLTDLGAIALGIVPTALTTADVDREGTPDLLIAESTGNVQLHPALGNGTFSDPLSFPVGAQPVAVASGDFDEDGHDDVVTLDGGPGTLSLLLSDGAGGLAPVDDPFDIATNPVALTLGDFNGDDNLDAVAAATGLVSLIGGNGAALFGPPFEQAVPDSPSDLAAGDLNEDGRLDLVVTSPGLDAVTVLLGNGFGDFGGAIPFAVGVDPQRLLLVDLDHDGHLDVITINRGDDTLSVLIGDGVGGLDPAVTMMVGPLPVTAVVADLDGDGAEDLVVAHDAELRIVRSDP